MLPISVMLASLFVVCSPQHTPGQADKEPANTKSPAAEEKKTDENG